MQPRSGASDQSIHAIINDSFQRTQDIFAPIVTLPTLTWSFDDDPHFETRRGYAVTRVYRNADETESNIHLGIARKLKRESRLRILGILRHEMGHVIDFSVKPPSRLDAWVMSQFGYTLPTTRERRADALAHVIWGTPIYYDADDIQTIHSRAPNAVFPRPRHLGL